MIFGVSESFECRDGDHPLTVAVKFKDGKLRFCLFADGWLIRCRRNLAKRHHTPGAETCDGMGFWPATTSEGRVASEKASTTNRRLS